VKENVMLFSSLLSRLRLLCVSETWHREENIIIKRIFL